MMSGPLLQRQVDAIAARTGRGSRQIGWALASAWMAVIPVRAHLMDLHTGWTTVSLTPIVLAFAAGAGAAGATWVRDRAQPSASPRPAPPASGWSAWALVAFAIWSLAGSVLAAWQAPRSGWGEADALIAVAGSACAVLATLVWRCHPDLPAGTAGGVVMDSTPKERVA